MEDAATSKTRKAYKRLRSLIEDGEFRQGQRITEAMAARLIGMNRGPVRESLLKLEAEGLLISQGTGRSRIVAYTEDQDPRDLLHRYELREHVEGAAARLAAKSMNGWEIDRLRHLARQEQEAEATGDRQARGEAALRFHRFLLTKCGNPLMWQAWQAFRLKPTQPRSSSVARQIEARAAECNGHAASLSDIAEAIAAHDPELAERLIRGRIRAVTEALRALVMEQWSEGFGIEDDEVFAPVEE